MQSDTEAILKQFDLVEERYAQVQANTKSDISGSYVGLTLSNEFNTLCIACIERVAGSKSSYRERAEAALHLKSGNANICQAVFGVVKALKADVAAGYLSTLRELIHADLFSDLLETAEYFLNEGHKDPAAVVIGGVLETHLRQLCVKHGVDTERTLPDGSKKPKMGDGLNTDLTAANAYGKLDQKQVTAWLDLRNKAAHGQYAQYDAAQVNLLLQGVRDFISRNPA